ncbi:MAG: NTP transferase domain-containing protein [Nitrospinae bacterium]|nr:NTP transferase domain-containing protein [Nitrospinota bacterium]
MSNVYSVIMAGGKGTRFWPASREARPKQLLAIGSNESMIRQTVTRLGDLCPAERSIIVTGASHVADIRTQIPELPAANILAEPTGRNTAPCVALAAAVVAKRDPEGIMAVFPADHVITDPAKLIAVVNNVATFLDRHPDRLVTIGIEPAFAETGYGYIQKGAALANGLFAVEAFREKPDLPTAEEYVASGAYLWNAGMFFWKATTILTMIERHMPDLMKAIAPLADAIGTPAFDDVMAKVYPTLPSESIDYGVMEKAAAEGSVVVAPADPGWNDVGSWRSLYDLLAPDANGNRSEGELIAIESTGVLARSDKRLIAVVGVDDVVVVETPDAILVVHKEKAQLVKNVVDELKRRGRTDLL